MGLILLLFAPIAAVMIILGIKFWRTTLIVMFLWLLVEGVFRKWVFPQYQAPILLLKDVGFVAAYCGYMLSDRMKVQEQDRLRLLYICCNTLALYCLLEIANPALPSVWLGVYGWKNYLLYVPLAFIMPELFKTRESINRLVFWTCVATIPVCLLGLYQFTQPATSWVNHYVSHEAGTENTSALFGARGEGEFIFGRARTASTFSFISGFTTFLMFAIPFVGSRLLVAAKGQRQALIAGAALVLSIGAIFTTGARTPVFVIGATAPMLMLVAGTKGLLPMGTAFRLFAFLLVATAVSYIFFGDAASAFMNRAENSDDASSRLLTPLIQTAAAFETSPVFGFGVGANSNAAASLGGPDLYWLQGNFFEMESARVMQEIGLMGFALLYFIKGYVIYLIIKYLMWSRSKLFVALHAAALAYVAPFFILFTVNNPTGGVIYWALIGLSVAMHRLERRERAALFPQQAEPPPRTPATAAIA